MGEHKRFEESEVWQSARALVQSIYSISAGRLFSADRALVDQIRRASVSIASNIAEGFDSQSNPSFCRFLSCARGSAAEVRSQLYLALDLGYISKSDCGILVSKCGSIGRQLTGFIEYLKRTTIKSSPGMRKSGIRN